MLGDRLRPGSDAQLTEQLILELAAFSVRDAGVPEGMLPRLASDAMLQQRLLVNNPREVNEAQALAIYQAAC